MVAHFLQGLAYASMLLLPLYLEHLEASRTEIGLVMGAAAVSGLVTRPYVGWALDRHGRKPVVVAGTALVVVAMLMIGAVDAMGPLIYLERIVFGIGIGTLFSGYFTFAADLVPEARRTEGLALFGISGLLPMAVAPLSERLGVGAPELRWFLPLMGLVAGMSLFAIPAIPEPTRATAGPPPSISAILRALRRAPLWPVWIASVTFAGLVAVFATFSTVAAEAREIAGPARLWLAYAIGAVSVRAIGARVPDRLGPQNLIAPALAAYVGAFLLLAEASTMRDFFLAAGLAGLGHGCAFPVLTSQLVSRTPASLRGSAVAGFTALWQLCELLAAPIFGLVADGHGDAPMFLLAGTAGIAMLVGWLVLEHRFGATPAPAP